MARGSIMKKKNPQFKCQEGEAGCPLNITGKSVFEIGSWRDWMPFCAMEETIRKTGIRSITGKNVKEETEEREGQVQGIIDHETEMD